MVLGEHRWCSISTSAGCRKRRAWRWCPFLGRSKNGGHAPNPLVATQKSSNIKQKRDFACPSYLYIYIYLYTVHMFISAFIKVFLSWHDPSCFDLAKSQTGTQKIAASATAAQRMAQRFPSRLDNADEFQVIVQRGASRDLLDLALFICIESHLGKVGVGGGLWPLIGEMMEWMVANHQDVYTDIWWSSLMISYWDLQNSPWWFFAIFWWHKIMVEQEDRGYAMRLSAPSSSCYCTAMCLLKAPKPPKPPPFNSNLSLSFLEIVWQRQSQSMPYSILIAVWL